MSLETRTTRLANRLPVALSEGPVARGLLSALAQELEAANHGLLRLYRSRHLPMADAWGQTAPHPDDEAAASDLGRVGALIGLTPYQEERPAAFRDRVLGLMAVHRAGLGTAEAVLRLAAMALRAEGPVRLEIQTRGPDRVTLAHLKVRVQGGVLRPFSLEVVDNPQVSSLFHTPRWVPGKPFTVTCASVQPASLEIQLRAAEPLVYPMVHQGGNAVLYAGVVPADVTLQLRPEGARFDGVAAPAPVLALTVDVLDDALRKPETPARFAAPTDLANALRLPTGVSHWQLSLVSPGAVRSLLLEAGLPAELPEGEGDPCEAQPQATFVCEERLAAAFTLRFPDILPAWAPDRTAVVTALRQALDYGRAAGIEARLQLHIGLTETLPLPTDRAARATLKPRDVAGPTERMSARSRLTLQEKYRTTDRGASSVGYTRLDRSHFNQALLARAGDAAFDSGEHKDAVRLDYDALAEATGAVFGHARFDREALAWAGTVPSSTILAALEVPLPLPTPGLKLDIGRLDERVLALAPPSRFDAGAEGHGIVLDQTALAFGLVPGVFGAARFGTAGYLATNPEEPPEGWPGNERKSHLTLEVEEDLGAESNSDSVETGEDNG